MDQGIRNPVLRILVYGHVWLALGAAAQAWWMADLLDLDQRWPVAAFAACATFGSYTFMRLVRGGEAEMLNVPHLAWVRKHRKTLVPTATACLLVAALIVLLERERSGPWVWLFAALAALYVVPLPGRGRVFGLRWVPGLKALLIALLWAVVTVWVPLRMSDAGWDAGLPGWLFAMQFCFFLSLAITFDLRDLPVDPRKLRTIPQLLGSKLAKSLAVVLLLYPLSVHLLLAYLSFAMDEPGIPASLAWDELLVSLGYVVTAIIILRSGPERGTLYYGLLLDGMLVLLPLLAWLGGIA